MNVQCLNQNYSRLFRNLYEVDDIGIKSLEFNCIVGDFLCEWQVATHRIQCISDIKFIFSSKLYVIIADSFRVSLLIDLECP